MAQQGNTAAERAAETKRRVDAAGRRQAAPPPIQRDTTDLGALARSVASQRVLPSRDLRSSKPMGLARPAARSLKNGGR